jgi:hypothetical protein
MYTFAHTSHIGTIRTDTFSFYGIGKDTVSQWDKDVVASYMRSCDVRITNKMFTEVLDNAIEWYGQLFDKGERST